MGEKNRRLGKDRQQNKRVLERFRRTCAVTIETPKTAALVFEKVVGTIDGVGDAPIDIVSYKKGKQITSFPAISAGGPAPEERQVKMKFRDGFVLTSCPPENLRYLLNNNPTRICEEIEKTNHRPVLCYPRFTDDMEAFKAGDYGFIVACITNLGVVDEDRLTWEQVVEFRRDLESRANLARFLFWLDTTMSMKSKAEIQDHLCDLYEKQQRALRKFDIYTRHAEEMFVALGEDRVKNSLISMGALAAGTGLALATSPIWGVLAGGVVLASTVAATVRKARADIRGERDAVAFIQGLSNRLGSTPSTVDKESVALSTDDKWTFR